jgi:hypothetical protein
MKLFSSFCFLNTLYVFYSFKAAVIFIDPFYLDHDFIDLDIFCKICKTKKKANYSYDYHNHHFYKPMVIQKGNIGMADT